MTVASTERTSAAIDWAKALAILAVVVTHAGLGFIPVDPLDAFVRITCANFHVPVFLLVSGYLHCKPTSLTVAQTWTRLRRVLGPYVVASVALTVFRLTRDATWPALPWNLATGAAYGIYYYVPVWCGCVLTGLAWSRLTAAHLLVALAAVVLASEWRVWHPTWNIFWGVRDPLLQGWLLCYLGGWCARRFEWVAVVHRYPAASVVFAIAASVPWLVRTSTAMATDLRLMYSTSVVVVIVALARSAPAAIRWLSRETLWIYLGHLVVLVPLVDYASAWRPIPRIVSTVTITLGVCVVAISLGRHLQSWRGGIVPATRRAA